MYQLGISHHRESVALQTNAWWEMSSEQTTGQKTIEKNNCSIKYQLLPAKSLDVAFYQQLLYLHFKTTIIFYEY